MKKKGSGFRVQGSGFRQSQAGFTLVEIILYMALVAIFIITLTDIFVSILDIRTESEATSAVEQDGRFILSRLHYDIPRSTSIINPANLGDTSDTLELDIEGITHTYSLVTNNLELEDGTGTFNVNSSEATVSVINFQKIGNVGGKETIRIQFDIESVTQRPSGPETRSFTTTVGRR